MALENGDIIPNLPHVFGAFIGRVAETTEIEALLATARLFTLTGTGGSGKTRQAAEIAREMRGSFRQGVRWVDLSTLVEPSLLPHVVAAQCGVADQGSPLVIDALVATLRTQHVLLVLDNCEHLLTTCAHLIGTLLTDCPELHILTTSREALALPGEVIWLVRPLRIPEGDTILAVEDMLLYESVELFVTRAASVLPGFTLTAENVASVRSICRQLDGLPLALELAAARLRTVSLVELAERLGEGTHVLNRGSRTAHPRQQTLRTTLDWSYDLLTDMERAVFCRLACFSGSFTSAAAEMVCAGTSVATADVFDTLTGLIEKSLVLVQDRQRETRYRLLEPLRHYAMERLAETDSVNEVGERHRDWYAAFATRASAELGGHDQGRWLDRLVAEHDNLRAALSWCLAHDEAVRGGEIAANIWQFWFLRGHVREGRRWMAQILAVLPEPMPLRAHLLWIAGIMARPDAVQGKQYFRESLALWQVLGDHAGIARSLSSLGFLAQVHGEHEQAMAYLEQSLPLVRASTDVPARARVLSSLALSVLEFGDLKRAITLCTEGLALHQQVGDQRGSAASLVNLGLIWQASGDEQRATALWNESLDVRQRIGDQGGVAHVLTLLGSMAVHHGAFARATELMQQSLTLRQQIGELDGVAPIFEGLAAVTASQDNLMQAVRFAGAADALRVATGVSPTVQERTSHDRTLAILHARLAAPMFAQAWVEGQTLSVDQAISMAMALSVQSETSPLDTSSVGNIVSQATTSSIPSRYNLTPREIDVLRLLTHGLTYAQIGESLVISPRTVDAHIRAIFGKLDVRSRTAATRIALHYHLI